MKEKLQLDNFEKYLERKKQLVIKEYDSLFTVFGRQTTIIYNYRTWTIGLITAYITLFYSKQLNFHLNILLGYYVILLFAFLEISERSINSYLLKEIRSLEKIFMIKNKNEFDKAIDNYEFRDLRDSKRKNIDMIKEFYLSIGDPKVFVWYILLFALYYYMVSPK